MHKKLIERLRNERQIPPVTHDDLIAAADALERLQTERDAAVADLTAAGLCDYCVHWRVVTVIKGRAVHQKRCVKCGKCEFEWRGAAANELGKDARQL